MNKFGGLGLKNLVVVALFVMIFIVMMKVITNKYDIPGLKEVASAV